MKEQTILLYHTDSYLREFPAIVVRTLPDLNAIVLDCTAFYPGGGGQLHDLGEIQFGRTIIPIVKVKHSENGILHMVANSNPLPRQREQITGIIDWDRRYKMMRTHTAMHILCGVIFRDYHALVTGGDMEPLKGRMDFEFETMTKELVETIELAVNQEVKASRSVITKIIPREEAFQIPDLIRTKINLLPGHIQEVRIVEIAGLDLQADGGTHVKNTAEVGQIHILDYKSKGKINKRIYLRLDNLEN